MSLEDFVSQYSGWLMLCFGAGWGVGFLIKMARRYFEKI